MAKKYVLRDTHVYNTQGGRLFFEKTTGFLYIGQDQYPLSTVQWIDWSETSVTLTLGGQTITLDCPGEGVAVTVNWLQTQVTLDSVKRLRAADVGMATLVVYQLQRNLICLYHNAPESAAAFEARRGEVTTVQGVENGSVFKKVYYLKDLQDKRAFLMAHTTRELAIKKQAIDVEELLKPRKNASGFNFPIRGSHTA